MRIVTKPRLFLIGVIFFAGSIALSANAQAQDNYDRDHYDRYRHDHERVVERPVYVAPRPPVVVAPPVAVAPAGPPSLSLNMNIPL